MPDEEIVSSSEHEMAAPEKSAPKKKRRAAPKRTVARPIQRARRRLSGASESTVPEAEIDHALQTIYKDDTGAGTDMQRLTVKRPNALWQAIKIILGASVVLAVLAWVGFFVVPGQSPANGQIEVSITGPETVMLGATSTYTITFTNRLSVAIKNITATVNYPEGFVVKGATPEPANAGKNEWRMNELGPGANGAITIQGLQYGTVKEQKSWRVFVAYTPANFNSELQSTGTLVTAVEGTPFIMTITGPDRVVAGVETAFTISVRTENPWKDPVFLALELPENFSLTSSSPAADAQKRWPIQLAQISGTSSPAGPIENTVVVRGSFAAAEKTAPLKAVLQMPGNGGGTLYRVASAEFSPEIVDTGVAVAVAINGAVSDLDSAPGDILTATIRLKNTSQKPIKNAVLSLLFEGPSNKRQSILKWSELVDQYDGDVRGEQLNDFVRKGEIVWNSKKISKLSELKPGEEITVDLRLPIKNAEEFDLDTIKVPAIKAVPSVSVPDEKGVLRPTAGKPLAITLHSDLGFETRHEVTDTTHAITWILTNNFHPLKNLVLTADVYGDVTFETKEVGAGKLTFDEKQKKITWQIPEMPESTDVFSGAFSLTLKTMNPTQNVLLSKARLEALDTVTNKKLERGSDEIKLNATP